MQYTNVLLESSMFTNKSSMSCLDIIEHERLCLVETNPFFVFFELDHLATE